MKKVLLTSLIILMGALCLLSCEPEPEPGVPQTKPSEPVDMIPVHIRLREDENYIHNVIAYVEEGYREGWTYQWSIGGEVAIDHWIKFNLSRLEWSRTYELKVLVFDPTGNLRGYATHELRRSPSLVLKENQTAETGMRYQITPILDCGLPIPDDQEFSWEIYDSRGTAVIYQPMSKGMIEFDCRTPGPVTVRCMTRIGDMKFDESITVERASSGILGRDMYVSGQGKVAEGNIVRSKYSPLFTYYNNDFSTDAEYGDYDYRWYVNGGLVMGDNDRKQLIDVSVKPEDLNGSHMANVEIKVEVTKKDDPQVTFTEKKYVNYLPFMDVRPKTENEGLGISFDIPFPFDDYDYRIEAGMKGKKGEMLQDLSSLRISDLVSFAHSRRWEDGETLWLRVRGREKGADDKHLLSTTIYSKFYEYRIRDGKVEWITSLTK